MTIVRRPGVNLPLPLKSGEIVTVTDIVANDRGYNMLAEIEVPGRTLGVL